VIGMEIAVGLLVAPVIFFPAEILGEGILTHYQSGILMTHIFLRFNMMLAFVSFLSFFAEAYMYLKKRGDLWAFMMSFSTLIAMGLFVFYFTPFILEAQSQGVTATQTATFSSMHKGSEIAVKIILITQSIILGRRVWLLGR
ncbi:MAG: DUF4149 domain-containing protein, partial [Campylobacteraceae bacterium]|nr:DUF4149 domain-containing protein [Campylobacteraceae bacterium]